MTDWRVAASSPAAASTGWCGGCPSSATPKPSRMMPRVLDAREAEEARDLVLRERVEDAGERGEPRRAISIASPHQTGSGPSDLEVEPPEPVEAGVAGDRQRRRAEPRRGAVAGGRPPWSGTTPIFEPKPTRNSTNATLRASPTPSGGVGPDANEKLPVLP